MMRTKELAANLHLASAVVLITHEIDSAYWHEWDLFKPGGIQLFLLLHIVIIGLVLYGYRLVVLWDNARRLSAMRVFGIDFTSRPRRSKPLTCIEAELIGDLLRVEVLMRGVMGELIFMTRAGSGVTRPSGVRSEIIRRDNGNHRIRAATEG